MSLETISTDELRAELEARMRDIDGAMRGKHAEPDPLLYIVSEVTECPVSEITTYRRPKAHAVWSRALLTWAPKKYRRWISLHGIAEQLHRCDHTTSLYYLKVVESLKTDQTFRQWMEEVDKRMRDGKTRKLQTKD